MSKWQEYSDKFIALTQREKVIILATCLFLMTYGLFFLLIEPVLNKQVELEKRQQSSLQQIADFEQQIAIIQQALKEDPNLKLKEEIKGLKVELAKVDAELSEAMTQYVAPTEMASKLTKLLQTSPGLRVTELLVLKPQRIDTSEVDTTLANNVTTQTESNSIEVDAESLQGENLVSTNASASAVTQLEGVPELYSHRISLTVQGGYFDLMKFVKSVLDNNKQFAVNDLNYVVETHPEAKLTLSLVTISDNENVIKL